jgi:glutamine amidotransferase
MKVAIIDYEMGNLRSVFKAVERSGGIPIITNKEREIIDSDKIILPGVGHFKRGMENLKRLNLIEILNLEVIVKKKPILGICLGMQLMMEHSEEGNINGLSWFQGKVVKFNVSNEYKFKVPHMGWNTLNFKDVNLGVNNLKEYYFVHSFHVLVLDDKDVVATTTYDYEFVSFICRENIMGYQFHPEKSHTAGLELVSNFIKSHNV